VTFLTGMALMVYGVRVLGRIGEGGAAQLLVAQIGRLTGIHLNLKLAVFVVVLVGLALALAAAGYALKALKEARATEEGAKATIRHFSP
jgi:hypothetical protein